MAIVQHDVIADPDIHETKGVSSAAAGAVYVADGSGGGSWRLPGTTKVGAHKKATIEELDSNLTGSGNDQVITGTATSTINQNFASVVDNLEDLRGILNTAGFVA